MLGFDQNPSGRQRATLEMGSTVSAFLYERFSADQGPLSRLDRWTQRRIAEENLAKLALVVEAADPVEHCYQNLVREIDTEAESGIFLANVAADSPQLRRLSGVAGISGRLHEQMQQIAPQLFSDALEHSSGDLDLVWVSIKARFERAHADAGVSEQVMARLVDDVNAAHDMTDALRSLLYAYHEDIVRAHCSLPAILEEIERADLLTMIAALAERAGSYDKRVREIARRAGTA